VAKRGAGDPEKIGSAPEATVLGNGHKSS